jgi:hypothetical protein
VTDTSLAAPGSGYGRITADLREHAPPSPR